MVHGAEQSSHRLRILHLSDLHLRGPRETNRARRVRVLRKAWFENLAELHWRGYSETRFRMCDAILRRSARLRSLGRPATEDWSNLIGNLHVDQGWVLFTRGEHSEARRLAVEARAWIGSGDRMYADELEAQAAFLSGDHQYAVAQFSALTEQAPERTRPWHLFTMRLADVQLAVGDVEAHDHLLTHLLTTMERPRLASGEVFEDVRARILMRCAARDFARSDQLLGMDRLSRAVELFETAGGVIADRIRAMIELAKRSASIERRTELLHDALRYARMLGARSLISEVEHAMPSSTI